jgi:hypothetical protein
MEAVEEGKKRKKQEKVRGSRMRPSVQESRGFATKT